jgi:hypothetical protein
MQGREKTDFSLARKKNEILGRNKLKGENWEY